VTLRGVRVHNNANNGLLADTTGTTNANGISVSIDDSQFAGNTTGVAISAPTVVATVAISNSTVANNSGTGITASGINGTAVASNVTITGNQTGVSVSAGGGIKTFDDNRLEANPNFNTPNNGAFGGTPLDKK
jgi:hypothetical protein